jgi:hypothetical protein
MCRNVQVLIVCYLLKLLHILIVIKMQKNIYVTFSKKCTIVMYYQFLKNMSLTVDVHGVSGNSGMQILNNLRTPWKICFKNISFRVSYPQNCRNCLQTMQTDFFFSKVVTIYISSFLTSFLVDMSPFLCSVHGRHPVLLWWIYDNPSVVHLYEWYV